MFVLVFHIYRVFLVLWLPLLAVLLLLSLLFVFCYNVAGTVVDHVLYLYLLLLFYICNSRSNCVLYFHTVIFNYLFTVL